MYFGPRHGNKIYVSYLILINSCKYIYIYIFCLFVCFKYHFPCIVNSAYGKEQKAEWVIDGWLKQPDWH